MPDEQIPRWEQVAAIAVNLFGLVASAAWLALPLWLLVLGGGLSCNPMGDSGYRVVAGPDPSSGLVGTFWMLLFYVWIFGAPGWWGLVGNYRTLVERPRRLHRRLMGCALALGLALGSAGCLLIAAFQAYRDFGSGYPFSWRLLDMAYGPWPAVVVALSGVALGVLLRRRRRRELGED